MGPTIGILATGLYAVAFREKGVVCYYARPLSSSPTASLLASCRQGIYNDARKLYACTVTHRDVELGTTIVDIVPDAVGPVLPIADDGVIWASQQAFVSVGFWTDTGPLYNAPRSGCWRMPRWLTQRLFAKGLMVLDDSLAHGIAAPHARIKASTPGRHDVKYSAMVTNAPGHVCAAPRMNPWLAAALHLRIGLVGPADAAQVVAAWEALMASYANSAMPKIINRSLGCGPPGKPAARRLHAPTWRWALPHWADVSTPWTNFTTRVGKSDDAPTRDPVTPAADLHTWVHELRPFAIANETADAATRGKARAWQLL